VLNSERASLYADVFTEKFERTRREQLEAIMAGYFDEEKASKVCNNIAYLILMGFEAN
jgi:hypothetical protein